MPWYIYCAHAAANKLPKHKILVVGRWECGKLVYDILERNVLRMVLLLVSWGLQQVVKEEMLASCHDFGKVLCIGSNEALLATYSYTRLTNFLHTPSAIGCLWWLRCKHGSFIDCSEHKKWEHQKMQGKLERCDKPYTKGWTLLEGSLRQEMLSLWYLPIL